MMGWFHICKPHLQSEDMEDGKVFAHWLECKCGRIGTVYARSDMFGVTPADLRGLWTNWIFGWTQKPPSKPKEVE
jgi:hypothetical protein